MSELQVIGRRPFMGKEIPIVFGGFGEDKKCICDKTIAEIHGVQIWHIRQDITSNIKYFEENIDYIDVAITQRHGDVVTLELLKEVGYSQQSVVQSAHIYILSERGYLKLVKIMDNEKAWEIYNNLLDEYFYMREERKQMPKSPDVEKAKIMRAEATRINAATKALGLLLPTYQNANIDPAYIAIFAHDFYKDAGLELPELPLPESEKKYDLTMIAKELGIVSATGKPHAQAIGAILTKLPITEQEIKRVPFMNNGHSDSYIQYSKSVLNKVDKWLNENGYPMEITSGLKTYKVLYQM